MLLNSRNSRFLLAAASVLLVIFGCGQDKSGKVGEKVESSSGLIIEELVVGSGDTAEVGKTVSVNYTGMFEDGKVFDTSLQPGRGPFEFSLGAGMVIKGWDEGVNGMKVGGKRKLTIPSHLAYGERGAGGVIPPNSTL